MKRRSSLETIHFAEPIDREWYAGEWALLGTDIVEIVAIATDRMSATIRRRHRPNQLTPSAP